MCGKINEIPILGMPKEWYEFVKTEGTSGTPPKNMEDAINISKVYNGMHILYKIMKILQKILGKMRILDGNHRVAVFVQKNYKHHPI